MFHRLWKLFEKHFKFSVILQSRDPLTANDLKFTEILFKIFAIVQTLEVLESPSDSQEAHLDLVFFVGEQVIGMQCIQIDIYHTQYKAAP